MVPFTLERFVTQSNAIEGIARPPTTEEIDATGHFIKLLRPTVRDLENLVRVYAPGHRLRDQYGLDVRVGSYVAPSGCPEIRTSLEVLLDEAGRELSDPWDVHIQYETLHPFTDGNGRSGRALWLWMMGEAPLGFLHHFYYQTLEHSPGRGR